MFSRETDERCCHKEIKKDAQNALCYIDRIHILLLILNLFANLKFCICLDAVEFTETVHRSTITTGNGAEGISLTHGMDASSVTGT